MLKVGKRNTEKTIKSIFLHAQQRKRNLGFKFRFYRINKINYLFRKKTFQVRKHMILKGAPNNGYFQKNVVKLISRSLLIHLLKKNKAEERY